MPALATLLLVVGAVLQLAVPSSTKLPPDPDLAPRRVHEPAQLLAQDYPTVLEKPIFAPDRKPDATAVPVAGEMSGFAALGIAMAGDTVSALVRGPGGLVQRLKPGDSINGWKLVSAASDQLTFERNKERRVLMITRATTPIIGAGRLPGQPGRPGQAGITAQMGQADNTDNSNDDDNSDDDN